MGSTGSKLNQAGVSTDALSDLIAALADPEIRVRLSKVVARLSAIRQRGDARREPKPQRLRKRRPGWMPTAVLTVLAERGEPMQVGEIRTAVEALVGEAVPKSSVKNALASNVGGSSSRFVRVARGRYRLR